MTGALTRAFEERLQEIEAYLDLLATLEDQIRSGPPRIGEAIVTSQQQKILYSSVYVQIYNLVEATITWCVEGVCAAAADPTARTHHAPHLGDGFVGVAFLENGHREQAIDAGIAKW